MKTAGDWRTIANEEMLFFGDVSAAISHEINNRMAVISEKAGLLEDLATRLTQGKEVDPERFGVQSRKILEQVTASTSGNPPSTLVSCSSSSPSCMRARPRWSTPRCRSRRQADRWP
jgi:hypothetical protein